VSHLPETDASYKLKEILQNDKAKVKEWLNHAEKFIKLYFNGKFTFNANDIVGDILLKTASGERRWNSEKVDINKYMYYAIWSHVQYIAKKESRMESADNYNEQMQAFFNKYEADYSLPLNEIELEQDNRERLEIIRSSIKDDEDCEIIFNCLCQGMTFKETAEDLGISEQEVKNAVRRIKYRVQKGLPKKS